MKIRLVQTQWHDLKCDALLVPVFEDDDLSSGLAAEIDRRLDGLLSEIRASGEWKGRKREIVPIFRPTSLPMGRLILIGAGRLAEYDAATIRQVIMEAVYKVKAYGLQTIAVWRRSDIPAQQAAQAAVEGVVLGTYGADEFKTEQRNQVRVQEILFATDEALDENEVGRALQRGAIIAHATNQTRSLVNQPGNLITPLLLTEAARELAQRYGLELDVLEELDLQRENMNAILAVARGSDEPARLIVLKHLGANDPNQPFAALVGKGVTFDSGGLSLKPPKSMEEMKADKAGACAVLGAMRAIAELQVPRNVVGIIPAVENLPSGRAQRPGDVVRAMSGKTIEVLNTDAEGRLILADALHYAERFDPSFIVDIATLTGACMVALGRVRAGLFCNDDALYRRVLEAAEAAGERVWRLPLDEEYRRDLDSDVADLKNIGERWGGACSAAKFLEEFVNGRPWCHLDIAGVDNFADPHPIKGPTGFGVRTMVELVCR